MPKQIELESSPTELEPVSGEAAGVKPAEESSTGFEYVNPRQLIVLDEEQMYLSDLPKARHYEDREVRSAVTELRRAWRDAYAETYARI